MTWLAHFLGFTRGDSGGSHYLFWSGAGSDIGELAMLGWLAAFLRRHNCEIHGCWRLGRHATAARHMLCRRHHPEGHLTPLAAARAHTAAQGYDTE